MNLYDFSLLLFVLLAVFASAMTVTTIWPRPAVPWRQLWHPASSTVVVVFLLSMAACGSLQQNAQVAVYVSGQGLAEAETLATTYASLPQCGTNAPPLCANPLLVLAIKNAATTAHNAFHAAQTIVTNPATTATQQATAQSAASAAFKALTSLTSTVKVN